MLDLEQMVSWTPTQIQAAIQAMVPDGWAFQFGVQGDRFQATFQNPMGEDVWTDTHWDTQNLLLSAYGWLWMRLNGPVRRSTWQRRAKHGLRHVPGLVTLPGITVPDPEDLDPGEINAVYTPGSKA